MMEEISTMSKERSMFKIDNRVVFLFFMLLVGSIAVIAYSIFTGNDNQVFTDIVNEFTALNGSNKSAEKNLFYIFSIAGAIVYSIYYLLTLKKTKIEDVKNNAGGLIIAAFIVLAITPVVLYKSINLVAVSALIIAVVTYFLNRAHVVDSVISYFIFIYALIGLYRLYVYCGGERNLKLQYVLGMATLMTLTLLVISKKKTLFLNAVMLGQLLIPFSLLIYLSNKYIDEHGTAYKIVVLKPVLFMIMGLVFLFVAEAIIKIIKYSKGAISLQNAIGFGTPICIMAFNQYYGTGAVIKLNQHHHFEDIIGYSQIFELGQVPYKEYIPVSGLYSVIHGAIFKFFGNGLVSYYNVATNIFYLLIIIAIVCLLKMHLDSEWVLFVSLVFYLGNYNRIILMAPIFLLLSLPKLIEKRNLWLMTWVLTSYLHGLYYPVYGAAICLGFMPLGILIIYWCIKSGELKSDIKTVRFWLCWIITIIPIILGLPLLIGSAKHMLAMASQTIYADGVTRFGQIIPEEFFPYISSIGLRLLLYYLVSYLVIISIVWISVAVAWTKASAHVENKKLRLDNPVAGLLSVSIAIIALVSISYSVVRLDIDEMFSRSEGFIKLSFLAFVVITFKYMLKTNRNAGITLMYACFLVAIASSVGIYKLDIDAKLEAFYKVPEDYVYVSTDDRVEKIQDCFKPDATYEGIEESYEIAVDLPEGFSYLGVFGNFGEYYLNEIKGDSVLELYLTVKGYEATQETIDLIKKNNTLLGFSMDPVNNYYIYHYLATSGEYIWSPEKRLFMPTNGQFTLSEVLDNNKEYMPALEDADLRKTPGSWGSSMDSLNSIFTKVDVDCKINTEDKVVNISFNRFLDGNQADFIYIEFANMDKEYDYTLFSYNDEYVYDVKDTLLTKYLMKKSYNMGMNVILEWQDDDGESHQMSCRMDEGHLLIPVGAGKGWLFDSHDNLKIMVTQDDETIEVPEIKEIRMLKVREIGA